MRIFLLLSVLACALAAQDMPFPVPPRPAKKARVAADGNAVHPHWVEASILTLAIAEQTERPLFLYFPADDSDDLYGDEMNQLSTSRALFIRYGNTATPAASPGIVPYCKPLAANPRAAYGIPDGKDTALLCDWHGNEYFRFVGAAIRPAQLEKLLEKLPQAISSMRARLAKRLTNYESSETRRDRLVALLKAMRDEVWGLPEARAVVLAYQDLLREGAAELQGATQAGDFPTLEALRKDFKGTDLAPAIEAAIAKLRPRDG